MHKARRDRVDGEDRTLSLRSLLCRDRQGAQGADQVKEELVLVLTPQLIENIRRRRHQRIEARKNSLDIRDVGVVDLGEIEFEEERQ